MLTVTDKRRYVTESKIAQGVSIEVADNELRLVANGEGRKISNAIAKAGNFQLELQRISDSMVVSTNLQRRAYPLSNDFIIHVSFDSALVHVEETLRVTLYHPTTAELPDVEWSSL